MATKETVQYEAAEPRPDETKEGLLPEAADLRRQNRPVDGPLIVGGIHTAYRIPLL